MHQRALTIEGDISLRQRGEQGGPVAQNDLGIVPEHVTLEGDISLRQRAEQGDAKAQNNLGLSYALGLGVPEDDSEAVRWYRVAAEQGAAKAQYNLGAMYAQGTGVPQDDKEAVRWWRAAAQQGHMSSQNHLGGMYAQGTGVPQDYKEAVRWYRAAAEQGAADAQNNLGWLYATAKDPKYQDPKKAIEYAKKAVEGSQEKEPAYLDTLAEAYYSNREYDKAIQTIKEAIALKLDWDYAKGQLQKFEQAKQSKGRR